jgi:hypothetical protein
MVEPRHRKFSMLEVGQWFDHPRDLPVRQSNGADGRQWLFYRHAGEFSQLCNPKRRFIIKVIDSKTVRVMRFV